MTVQNLIEKLQKISWHFSPPNIPNVNPNGKNIGYFIIIVKRQVSMEAVSQSELWTP
jgi:hypothetical protein